jgi:Tfp pilus assembly major pilin PilA
MSLVIAKMATSLTRAFTPAAAQENGVSRVATQVSAEHAACARDAVAGTLLGFLLIDDVALVQLMRDAHVSVEWLAMYAKVSTEATIIGVYCVLLAGTHSDSINAKRVTKECSLYRLQNSVQTVAEGV